MGGVAVLHSSDVLRNGYNRMPLISPSLSTNQALKSRITNTSSFSNSKADSSFNRRKKSPQKKSNFDHNSNVHQKKVNSTVDQTSNYSKKKINDLPKSPQKTSNFDHNSKVSPKKINDFDKKANSGNLAKGGANFSNGKISTGNKPVMEKVKILKRGEVLANDEDTKIERVLSDKENVIVNLVDNEVSNAKKKLLFDEENKCEKVVNVEKNGDETMSKKMFAKENKFEKVVEVEKNGDEKTPKKMVLFDRDGKNKKKGILEKNGDSKPNVDLDLVDLRKRLGPEPKMVTKHIPLPELYATAAFIASPDPSSLPFPPFLKKEVAVIESSPKIDSSEGDVVGTNLLRKLLNLAS